MKLIVGLGNPGKEYKNTRHNSGFLVIDAIVKKMPDLIFQEKWNALIGRTQIDGEKVLFVKPLTFMNLSGNAVGQIVHYYQIEPEDILVVHDDMDLPVGSLRIRKAGTSGGQKGMQSIIDTLGTKAIPRIRIGVGHSSHGNHDEVADWVLSAVPKSEQDTFHYVIQKAAEACLAFVTTPLDKVMATYNIKIKTEKENDKEESNS